MTQIVNRTAAKQFSELPGADTYRCEKITKKKVCKYAHPLTKQKQEDYLLS